MGEEKSVSAGKDVSNSTIIAGDKNMVGNNNVVIHIHNIYGQIFDTPDFRDLVGRIVDMDRLRSLRDRTFIAQETVPPEQMDFNELIDELKRNNEFPRLLSEVKDNDPESFRKFLKGHALSAIGKSTQDAPDTSSLSNVSEQELNLLRQASEFTPPGTDIEVPFVNKHNLFAEIHKHLSNYIVVYGLGGVGKTYFLQNFSKKFEDTRCVYIDLDKFRVAKILPELVRQLNGEQEVNPGAGYLDLAKAITAIHRNNAQITRFFFLFDSADKNQDALDFIFHVDSLIDNKDFQAFLKARKLFDRINIKVVLAARKQIKPREPDSPFHQSIQIKYEPLSRDSVQVMLEELAHKNDYQVFPDDARTLSNMVFYLTGGHPGCVRPMLLVLNEQGFVTPGPEKWIEMYRQYVLPVIKDEMLSGLKMETQMHLFSLCIFRRLDQRLLGGLIDRDILSCLPGESSRLARELRSQLEQTQLFEPDHSTDTMVMNYALRHALTLNMQYESFERYKALQALALEIFLDRLQNPEITSGKAAARTVMHLFEMVYHWASYLEMDVATAVDQSSVQEENSKRLQRAFIDYLALAFASFRKADPVEFLRLLEELWDKDLELRETIQRATGNGECCKSITQTIEQFSQDTHYLLPGDSTTDAPPPEKKKKSLGQ